MGGVWIKKSEGSHDCSPCRYNKNNSVRLYSDCNDVRALPTLRVKYLAPLGALFRALFTALDTYCSVQSIVEITSLLAL